MKYLYNTGKYELIELANAKKFSAEEIQNLPWKCYGGLPDDDRLLHKAAQDPVQARNASYGSLVIDDVIQKEKPDIYLGIEDIWAFDGYANKPWWSKVHSIIHTTLDSLPILKEARDAAPDIKHYFVWASFAEKEMKKLGINNVKTVHGTLDVKNFYKLESEQRKNMRTHFGLQDNFVIGFVFRNQLRKSVPNLLNGFKLFQKQNPKARAKLLLHTNWAEGWDIPRLIEEKGVNNDSVVTTHICHNCNNYFIAPFKAFKVGCHLCGAKESVTTVSIEKGVDESQLNEIYNLMDVYCHPFTSGGQEIPVQEAKLCELITLVTNYSCGTDAVCEGSGGLPLDWEEYTEPGTQFIKSTTYPKSICDQLKKVYRMDPARKAEQEKMSRQYVIDNYSIDVVGKFFEDLFDSFEEVNWDELEVKCKERRDINYTPDPSLPNNEWIMDLYKNLLKYNSMIEEDSGFQYWMAEIARGKSRGEILNLFKEVAVQENKELFKVKLEDVIDKKRKNKRLAFVMEGNSEEILLSLGVISSLKKTYPDYDIYYFTDPKLFMLVDESDDIFKLCELNIDIHDQFCFEGLADRKGLFDLAFLPQVETRNIVNYAHHGKDIDEYTK